MPDDTDRPLFGGRYELYRRLARGGMAEVFLGRDQLLDRPVAVKVLFREFAADDAFVERFRREAQAAAGLSHPNVVGVYDWGSQDGTQYIVMEYVDGRSLAEIIRSEGPLHPDRAADIAADIAAALSFAHTNGMIHRDIKPGNVMLTRDGRVKVADFGIARAVAGRNPDLTQTGSVMGTATYISPEQSSGQEADQRSDVYSLSVVLYEMLTAGPPFTGDSPVAIAYKHVTEAPRPPSAFNSDVSPDLEAVCLHGLRKDPQLRYATAAQMRHDLAQVRAGAGAPTAQSAAAVPPVGAGGGVAVGAGGAVPPDAVPAGAAVGAGGAVPPGGASADDEWPPRRGGEPQPDAGLPDRTPVWIALVVVLLVVIAGLVFLLVNALDGEEATGETAVTAVEQLRVPQLVGLDWEVADAELRDKGFEFVRIEFQEREDVEVDVVFQQNPRAGLLVDHADTAENPITLFVSEGNTTVRVPAVLNRPFAEAEELLVTAGFAVERLDIRSDEADAGVVIEQSVTSTEERPQGTVITLTVSTGRGEVEVPNVEGQSFVDARVALARAGLVDRVERTYSTLVPADSVISSDPSPGTGTARGTVVTLLVSDGPEELVVPALATLSVSVDVSDAAAVAAELAALGFTARVRSIGPADPGGRPEAVVGLEPAAGTTLLAGSEVVVLTSAGPPTAVPSLASLGTVVLSEVRAKLTALGFESVVERRFDEAGSTPAGDVVRLEPAAGRAIDAAAEAITVVVAR